MISVIGRSTQPAPSLKASVQLVCNGVKPLKGTFAVRKDKIVVDQKAVVINSSSMNKLLVSGPMNVRCGPTVSTQVRMSHTDIQVPNFDKYRRRDTRDPTASNRDSISKRLSFNYSVTAGAGALSFYAAKSIVTTCLDYMNPSADVMCLAQVEVDLTKIPEGKNVTFTWQMKPLFVKHRTAEGIATAQAVDLSELRDPQTDSERVQDPKWLVLIGICTHLGCIPISDAGDYGGYYCPCHGSHYDSSGRIRKGPAPLNLAIPPFEINGNILVVG